MANKNNKSDYTKPFMDLLKYLPETYQSDVNISLFNNLFNRFLTKQEIQKVSGYIGRGNQSALVSRQIKENDVHRQAFQLQPILNNKIGSIEHMASWKDIQNELERLGVDINDFANWGSMQTFNWVPPIDINKLINYQDYYWVDLDRSQPDPQYITIRSRCATATSLTTFWDSIISQYGTTFPIADILEIDDRSNLAEYSILLIDPNTGIVNIVGDATNDLVDGNFFDITGTVSNDGTYNITTAPTYDGTSNTTSLTVNGLNANETIGTVLLRRFDKIVFDANSTIINGDYTELFEKGFVFFLRNLNNPELNNSFVTVTSSVADIDNKQTTVTIDLTVTDNTYVGGEASLEEQQSIYAAEKSCQCGALGGWDDKTLWDDNPAEPLWGDDENDAGDPIPDGISDHQNLLNRINNPGPPTAAGAQDDLWHDTVNNKLYQYDTTLGWKIIWNNFNLLIDATTGFALWDLTPECDTRPRIIAADQWIKQNKWQHKNDITNFAAVKRATQPIIEYDWDLELNEWTYTDYRWSYRAEIDDSFAETENTPPLIELEPITWWENENGTNNTIILDFRYGDLTDYFTSGKQVYIGDGTAINIHEVDYSEYLSSPTDYPYRTYITFKSRPTGDGNFNILKPNSYEIYPFETAIGDTWQGYGNHWLFLGVKDAVPVSHQVDNSYIPIPQGSSGITAADGSYEYRTSLYSQSYLILDPNGYKTFELLRDIPNQTIAPALFDTRSLRRKALFGFDDIRVYLSDLAGGNLTRQFGNYDEIGEAVLDVISTNLINSTTIEIIVGITDCEKYFNVGSPAGTDTIELYGNSGIGAQTFIVTAAAGNKITASTVGSPVSNIVGTPTNDGVISNIDNPLSDADFANTKDVTVYVMGVEFFEKKPAGLNVIIEVGAASMNELGSSYNKVRMLEDDTDFVNPQVLNNGNIAVGQLEYRRVDQIKTKINQYPLFDIFTVNGDSAFSANPIFGYKTSSTSEINLTGLRIVYDPIDKIYEFDQFLLDEDNGELLAYRDYANKQEDYWYNPETNVLKFWKETEWDTKTEMNGRYRSAVISAIEPDSRESQINGLYWYNTTLNKLYKRFIAAGSLTGVWNEVAPIDEFVTDINLQTIWKAGLNNELYIPDQVDWVRRSKEEYDIAEEDYITPRAAALLIEDPSLSESEAIALAQQEWYDKQSNDLSPSGTWIGDWEIPDPLYYNHLHENRKYLTSRELLTHFTTIIVEQPKIPGYSGTADGMFNLIPSNEVNYGFGGTIKEFNDGFDSMLSSTFVNNVTPRSLIEFAHDQYEALLNSLKEIYRRNATDLLTNIETKNILDLSSYVADEVITKYELNDQSAFVYGDTTTFTDVNGVNDLGVRNWIATLPYVALVNKHIPERIVDSQIDLNEVVHHDGHRNEYTLTAASADIISQLVITSPDPRNTSITIGESSANLPPNNISEFESAFGTQISNREGVYWYYIPSNTTNILYRYVVAESGINTPSSTYPDGTLWMDLTTGSETLRTKKTDFQGTITWNVVSGLVLGDGRLHNGTDSSDITTATISAWQVINLDILLGDTVFELETRLYDNVPSFASLSYDFDKIASENPDKYQKYLEEAFLDYVSQSVITSPYINSTFSSTDAFTWNYKHSATGGGLSIIEADDLTNSFLVAGNKTVTFYPCISGGNCPSTVTFYIKNSGINDGTWVTISSTTLTEPMVYNSTDDTTRIFVTGDVLDTNKGVIYSGILPSFKSTSSHDNLNDGSESGGDWRDLYTKMYNTPYPQSEPWALQGYTNKPDWWDTEYLNNDVDQWGTRRWKYKHGFDVVAADNNSFGNIGSPPVAAPYGTFTILGDFHNNFVSASTFTIDNSLSHAGTYTTGEHDTVIIINPGAAGTASIIIDDTTHTAAGRYFIGMLFAIAQPVTPTNNTIVKTYTIDSVNHLGDTFTIGVKEEIISGDITPNIDFINGALYDPSTNFTEIKIQGTVNDNTVSGRIIKTDGFGFGMWENIRVGSIPPGRSYPNGVVGIIGIPNKDILAGLVVPYLPTFNYFSVNISNDSISADGGTTTYAADDVFPPYWNFTNVFTSTPVKIDKPVRSLYTDFSTEIVSPNANYVFGDAGTVEWEWRTSSQFLYDQLTVAYRIDPSRYVSSTFGFNFTEIGELQIDRDVKNTPSHTRVNFHGDVVNGAQFKSNGLNQWYVNYNRYSGYDANFSDFRELWVGWKAPLTYQFASFIDTPSLFVAHRYVNITNFDYNITSKRAPGVEDFWLDAFEVGITNIPYDISRYDNQIDWRFDVKTNINISRNIKYYDVHNYQFYANTSTNECWLYTWKIVDIDTFNKTFTVSGDQLYVFTDGIQFNISGSTENNGTYDVLNASYDSISNTTLVSVNNNIQSGIKDGLIKANYRTIPWETGDVVYLSTSETLPIPLLGDTVNGLTKYFIIKETSTTFKLAETEQESLTGTAIDITSSGRKDQFVGEVLNTFIADKSNTNWRFYVIDKTNVLNFNTPHEVQGMQTLVNIIHGYDVYVDDQGWKINSDKLQLDPDTSKIINWQVEIERFITYAYSQRIVKGQTTDNYPVTIDANTYIFAFAGENRSFITGDPINIVSSNEVYPTPLSRSIRYYMIRDTLETFRLAASKQDALDNIPISITSISGIGDLTVSVPRAFATLIPEFEINPFRNSIWIEPTRGIVSNIITGPSEDIRSTQLIFNQNGEQIKEDQLRVYRQDKETKIEVVDALDNTGKLLPLVDPAYTLLHLGGLHLFIDAYEHAMVLNDYTSEGNLLYDTFIGLNVSKYEMLFNKQPEFTHRPNVGGYYLETFFNQGANLSENIEAGVENLRNAYDTYNTLETNLMTQYSRKSLGYEGTTDYLSNLNLSQKSQFLFWRGQIQSKGSINAVEAFINSRRFIDAKIDDFWAVKVGDFGSIGEKEFPEMYVTTVDARSNELRLEFINNDAVETQVEKSFTPIKMSNQERWYNQPDQTKVLRDNGKVMYFDLKAKNKMIASISGSPNNIIIRNGKSYIKHDLDCDSVEVTQYDTVTSITNTLVEGADYAIVNNNIIEFIQGGSPANSTDPIIIWGMVVNDDAQNPARIIDRESETQISPIQFWDPARGKHYSTAIHNVDLQNAVDPAEYTNTSQTVIYSGNWKETFVGTSWLNTENLDYVPYYSEEMIPDTTERFRNWGQLADWSGIEIFEWVESDVPPSEWDVLAAAEEGDRTIVEHLRKSGIARKVLLERATGSPQDWIPAVNKVEEQYTATAATLVTTNYIFSVPLTKFKATGSPLQYLVNVYINGKLFKVDADITPTGSPINVNGTYSISTSDIKESDVVRFVQLTPTDQTTIDAEIDAGNMLQEYEYTQVEFYDELGSVFYKYYFWVGNKGTKPVGKNRTMPILEAEIQLVSIPSAHMFFQKPAPATTVPTEDINILRTEITIADVIIIGSPGGVVTLDLPIAANTTVLVEVNGVDLIDSEISYTVGGTTVTVTPQLPNLPLAIGDEIKVTYTGVDFPKSIIIPNRFTQTIIRGLQGIVNADNRYTIRFTRNFTLRDNLDVKNENIADIELKNLHEEWKIFRQEQQYNIDRWQWDRITESIIGYKLTDSTVRVPSYERELYDEKFGTDTQYGFDDGQAFVNGGLALNSILTYLLDPEIDFTPIDINVFFAENDFETAENIIKAMDEIYNTFTFTNVNRIFFSVLKDAFTTKAKYPGIFKTSMISLHGIRPFQTSGVFDD